MEPSRHDDAPAMLSERYEVERELGRGGMAAVYLARDLKHDRPVALKLIRPEAGTAMDAERFLREIQILAKLQHPHIVPLIDSGEDDGRLYYVMPYIEGESLRERLAREPRLPVPEALRIACEVADALGYAHARGMVHRDIKPGNILFTAGHAVVTDFGIARACVVCAAASAQLTLVGAPMGTPAYMSPEQAAGVEEVDGRSDLYSLGCVLYEMLTGRPPFTGATVSGVIEQQRTAEAPPVRELRPEVSPGIARVLQRMLAKAPEQRYGSAEELLDALREVARAEGYLDATTAPPGRLPGRVAATASPARAATAPRSLLSGFLGELKRRHVFRVAAAYAVVAWLVIQVATSTFPYLELPSWLVTAVIVLAALGFPVALVLAWAFDITPGGMERTPPLVDGAAPARTMPEFARSRVFAFVGVGILIALAGFGLSSRFLLPPGEAGSGLMESGVAEPGLPGAAATAGTAPAAADRSIAVLPFANLSDSKENEYFSDGITDDVLTALATIGDLHVISRTSVMQYKGTTKPLRQIARELGVSAVLEGSVRRSGDQLRVTAQLIDARTDEHIWAQTYDRSIEDIFRVQSDIAHDIAAALQMRLSPEAERRMAMTPTGSLSAYDFYMRGQEYFYRISPQDNLTAIGLYRRALELDPDFALARAGASTAFTVQTLYTGDRSWLDSALVAARKAIAGHEDLAEAQSALGLAELYTGHPDRAREALQRAITLKPNFPVAIFGLATADMHAGRLVEALRGFRKAAALEPTTAVFAGFTAWVYEALGRYDEALAWHARAREVQPDYDLRSGLASIYLAKGEPERAAAEMQAWLPVARDTAQALLSLGMVDLWRGELASAQRYLERGIASKPAQRDFEAPALAYIALKSGQPARAAALIREGRAHLAAMGSISAMPGEIDWHLARLDALEGDRRDAVRHLEAAFAHGLRMYGMLRTDPLLESLRGDPGFERLATRMKVDVDRMWRQVQQEGG